MTTVVRSGLGITSTSAEARTNVEPRPRSTLGTRSYHCPWSRTVISWPRSQRGVRSLRRPSWGSKAGLYAEAVPDPRCA
jgi:hypothetical protein